MVQQQPKVITRNWLLLLLFAAVLPVFSFGQSSVTIGATSGNNHFEYGPYYRSSASSTFNYSKYAYLYTAAELGIPAGSSITKIEWLKATNGTVSGNNFFSVWMKNSQTNSLVSNSTWNSLISSAQLVDSSSFRQFSAGANNWEVVDFSSTPFTYNGGSLQIMTDFVFSGSASAANNFYINTATGKALGWATTTPISGTMTLSATSYGGNRPTIRITYSSGSSCSGTPVAGSAYASVSGSVCSGTSVDLNLSGNTIGSGITYQWQSSSDNVSWSNISSSSNISAITVSASTSLYYRAVVTCGIHSSNSSSVDLIVNPSLATGNYTINSSLPNSGLNFTSFSNFASALQCGISGPINVYVSPGTYNEQFKLGVINGTSSTNKISIHGNNATIEYASISASDKGVVTLDGADWIEIDNLNIASNCAISTQYGWGIFITNNADNIKIRKCNINISSVSNSADYAGIVVSGSSISATATGSNCDNISIDSCVVVGGFYGISLVGGNNTTSQTNNNIISNNTIRDFYLYGVYTGGTNSTSVFNNNIHRSSLTSGINTFYGIWVYNNTSNIEVYNNSIHDPALLSPQSNFDFYGIGVNNSASSGNIVYNNIIYNIQGNGEQNILYNNASDVKWYFNSVSSDYVANSGGLTRGFYQVNPSSSGSHIDFKNNNIVIKRTGSVGIRSCIDIEDNSANIIKSNNNYFGSSSVNIGVLNGTTYSTLLNWQNAAVDNNSISSDPVFISPLTGNLTPTSTLLNNAGVNISNISADYAGITRNNPPDIGAFEYSVNACSGTPTAGNLTAPNNVCSGVSFGMSLANFALGTGITFQWQSSPASSNTFTNISGATLPTYTANQSNAVKYRVVTTCTNSVLQQTSNVVTVNMSQVSLCYCASYATGVDGSDIKGVTFGSLSNSSTCTQTGGSGSILNSYSDYTGLVTPGKFTRGSEIPFSISIGTCDNVSNAYLKAYIDYNIDGDFSDPGEEIYSSNTFVTMNGTEVSGIIKIPNTAILGSTRLRIVLSETNNSASISSCGTYSNGETEDYDVIIVGNTGSQPALNVALSTNNSIKYLITNGTGISGTFFVLSESDTLKYDPINYTLYNSTAANLSSVTFDTTLAKVSNGRALLLSTGKNGKLINFTVKGLRSGIRYYLYAYSYTTTSGGNIYNAPVMIDSITTIVAPNKKSNVTVNSSEVNANTAILRWTNGNGSGRIIVVAKKTLSADVPVNDSLYTDNFAFGRGNSIGSSNYVVKTVLNYAPNENDSLVLTNLESGIKYQVTSYEFNVEERNLPLKNLYRYSANSSKVSFTTLQDYFAVGKTLVGHGYTQDFDNMTGASATVLPSGWQSSSSVTVDNGSSSSAGVKNYGLSSSASNRALGILGNAIIGVKIQNAISAATNTPWTSVIVKYTGQQWHNGDNSADSLKVQYSLNAYMFNDANQYLSNSAVTWNDASSYLNFGAPTSSPNNSALDGTLSQNSGVRVASIVANIPAQGFIWIRWVNSNGAVVSDGLAVDNIEIIPFTETWLNNGIVTAGAKPAGLNIVGNVTTNGDISVKSILNIEAGASLKLTSSTTKLSINGPLYGTGTIAADGNDILSIGGSALLQTIYMDPVNNTFDRLLLVPGSAATLGNSTHVKSYVSNNGGTLYTGGHLILDATNSSTAYIDKILNGGIISGNVTVKIVTTPYPNVRFISHPFSTPIEISQLNDNFTLDVTGGINQNIWYYNPTTSSLAGNTPTQLIPYLNSKSIYTGYTSITDAWNAYDGIRAYIPANTTLDFSGPINQGNVPVTYTSGASGINFVGNPFPAPVKLSISNLPGGVNSIYYFSPSTNNGQGSWYARTGTKIGGITIPMGAAFAAYSASNAQTVWNFAETDKQKIGSAAFLREEDPNDKTVDFMLDINKGTDFLDELTVAFDNTASSMNDFKNDAPKIENPGVDFYTKSSDNIQLAFDTRQYAEGTIIPVGIKKAPAGDYSISVAEWSNMPTGYTATLVDNYKNVSTPLNSTATYNFSIDSKPESQGEKRFYILLGKLSTGDKNLVVTLAPNPVSDVDQYINIDINGTTDAQAHINVVSITGVSMFSKDVQSVYHSQLQIPVNQLTAGIYFVEITVNGIKTTKQFIKQ